MRSWLDAALHSIEETLRAGSVGGVINLYANALRKCSEGRCLEQGRRLHAHLAEHGHSRSSYLCEILLQMYARCGELDAAKSLLETMEQPRTFCWNVMIGAYGRCGRPSEALQTYHRMMDLKVHTNDATFASVLSAVGSLRDVNAGINVHKQIDQTSCNSGKVGIALIEMYSRCKRTDLARAAFERFRPGKHVGCWNAMISAFAQNGHLRDAVSLFQDMDIEPDAFTLSSVVMACGSIGPSALETGRKIHESLRNHGNQMSGTFFVENALIGMYSKCGMLDEARKVFDGLLHKDVVSWTTIITAYAQNGHYRAAIDLYRSMDSEGTQPDEKTMASVLTACANLGALEEGRAIHLRAMKSCRVDTVLLNALINMYAKCNSVHEAYDVFNTLGNRRDVVSWTAVISAFARTGNPKKALDLYTEMQTEGTVRPNQVTFLTVLGVCSALGDVARGRSIHEEIRKTRFTSTGYLFVHNALIDMYANCSDIKSARDVFDTMHEKDAVTWTILIAGYAHFGYHRDALDVFKRMNIRPDVITFSTILLACSSLGSLKEAKEIHDRIVEAGVNEEPMLQNGLINMYAKCGGLGLARNIFEDITCKNVITWTSMIAAYAQQGHCPQALELYRRMNTEGLAPSIVTFVPVLIACSHGGLVEDALSCFHSITTDFGLLPTAEHYGCMIDVLGRSGHVKEAEELVRSMPFEPDEISWQTLLSACKLHQHEEYGIIAAENVMELHPENTSSYSTLSNMFT